MLSTHSDTKFASKLKITNFEAFIKIYGKVLTLDASLFHRLLCKKALLLVTLLGTHHTACIHKAFSNNQ